jgi:hypothetical protein
MPSRGLPAATVEALSRTRAAQRTRMPTTYMTVEARDVEAFLKSGWLVALPSRPHPVGDAYERIPLVWVCPDCPLGEPLVGD